MADVIISKKRFERFSDDDINKLISKKVPLFFAESELNYATTDDLEEYWELGDISFGYQDVTFFDDGKHFDPEIHKTPLVGNLFFVPSLLLQELSNYNKPLDFDVLDDDSKSIKMESYTARYYYKLLPIFSYINSLPYLSVVTIPGLGCGAFSGEFHNLQFYLYNAIKHILRYNHFDYIEGFIFDGYDTVSNSEIRVNGNLLLSRPFIDNHKGQLTSPEKWDERFSDCVLSSIVAWDHGSWPGNVFYNNIRKTDDGVKAAASNIMSIITNNDGYYDSKVKKYMPKNYQKWLDIVNDKHLTLNYKTIERL